MMPNAYERIRMRQNPALSSRVQVGGRPMPSWFSASLVNQSRATMSTPPPLPAEPPPTTDESEYEEIDHLFPRQNGNKKSGRRRTCSLCGNTNAVVSCEMCESQIFCGSCNDMYHRHPKRLHHVRKIIDTVENRPPLPPKVFTAPPPLDPEGEAPAIVATLPPVPPPRRNKRFGGLRSATSSPTFTRKTFDPMGTLKRFMGGMAQRPLPLPPKQAPPLPPKPTDFGRPITPIMGGFNPQGIDRRHSSPAPQLSSMQMYPSEHRSQNIPMTVHEFNNPRSQSISVANLSIHRPPSRNMPDWEDEEEYFARQRAHSISTLQRLPNSSQDASHFATLQRPGRGPKPPERPPPPVPPRNFSSSQSQLGFQSSQSVFNLNQMGMPPQQFGMMWNYPGPGYPMDFQQAAMMGYPGTMRRTPSNSSMGAGHSQQFFGWGPVGFGPPMTQQEMDMELMAARRGPEAQFFGPPRSASVSHSQPVTPQGSFRKKTRPTFAQERQNRNEAVITERFLQQNQQINNPRSSTPSSFARVNPPAPPSSLSISQTFPQDVHSHQEMTSPISEMEITESPEGPWTCEHCTFINPKSTKICTICCKTPSDGYRSMGKSVKVNTYNNRRKESSSSVNDDIPVIQSKLSISRGEKQQATINLIESVEQVKSSKDSRIMQGSKNDEGTSPKPISYNEDENDNETDEDERDEQELVRQAQHHQIRINTKKPKIVSAKSELINSNEDVYGSVPIQAMTISPKIEIRRPSKTVTTTGVGSSPPKNHETSSSSSSQFKSNKVDFKNPTNVSDKKGVQKTSNESFNDTKVNKLHQEHQSRSSGASSSSGKSETVKKVSSSKPSIKNQKSSLSVSTGVQADNGESGNESGASKGNSNSSSSGRSSDAVSWTGSEIRSDSNLQSEKKTSKGTSPPPQSISTQTYEELPATSSMSKHSMSKTSMTSMQSLQSEDFAPPKPVEMSEKALRYARKAQHHHQAKLKRSMSTHLTSETDPWLDNIDAHGRMYRSSSRHSLLSDTRSLPLSGPPSRDTSPPPRGGRFFEDLRQFPPTSWDRFPTPEDYFASIEDLVSRRRKDSVRSQEFELTRLLKDAEEYKYTPEDVQVALRMCGERNPIKWLQDNWSSMVDTVQTLSTKYGREKGEERNQIGTISSTEAKDALRANRGNVWAAVTECVEQRRKKFMELQSRGTFLREDILSALSSNHGNLDSAYVELSKAQLKPFLMRIWGPPSGLDNDAVPPGPQAKFVQNDVPIVSNNEEKFNATSEMLTKTERSKEIKSEQISQDEKIVAASTGISNLNKLSDLEPEPRLELLVSNAAKVSQEIEKAILELKLNKSSAVATNSETNAATIVSQNQIQLDIQPPQNVKSDEDESFADAISEATSPNQEVDNEILLDDEFEDEDVLEIEIDDTEANISEFIQNYEVVPFDSENQVGDLVNPNPNIHETAVTLPNQIVSSDQSTNQNQTMDSSTSLNPTIGADNISPNRMNSTEIEQLLNTLTTTFTEMGQFATEIKAKIASEIQQQLAVAVSNVNAHTDPTVGSVGKIDDNDQLYEPIALPESISNNVNKKIAKYKRLAAKKDQKSNRHKSPDARNLQKEESISPAPAPTTTNAQTEILSASAGPSEILFTTTEIKIAENISDDTSVGNDDNNPSHNEGFMDYEEVEVSRDEEEYDSGPDSEHEEEEISEEELEEEEIIESEGESEELVSSGDEPEVQNLFDRDGNGDYEEVEINQSSEFLIHSKNNNTNNQEPYINLDNDSASDTPPKSRFKPISTTTTTTTEADVKIDSVENSEPPMEELILPKTELEVKIDSMIRSGKVETVEKAELAIKLMSMSFTEEDSLYAANECSSLCTALSFLQQECFLCAGKFTARQMVSMLRCTHVCCQNCAKEYFTVQIRDKTIIDATCPFCSEPINLTEDTEGATDYFNHLDQVLKSLLEPRHHEMFQRKLRDWALAQTPNFKWCSKCSSGFITEPLQTRLICPDCNAVTCAICLEEWDKFNHDHRESKVKVCDSASKSIVDYLNENCIECPRCHFRFALARGGCMHLTCTQCRHEFCSGCSATFRMSNKCEAKLPICERLGLHAHHPRNCLFYLRDKEPETLCKLLEEGAIPYLKENSESPSNQTNTTTSSETNTRTCQVPIQKETADGLRDEICDKEAPEGYATVCKPHYVEYLGLLIWQNHLDPISILHNEDLEVIIRRANKKHPGRPYPTSDEEFRNRLLKVIQEEIPLE